LCKLRYGKHGYGKACNSQNLIPENYRFLGWNAATALYFKTAPPTATIAAKYKTDNTFDSRCVLQPADTASVANNMASTGSAKYSWSVYPNPLKSTNLTVAGFGGNAIVTVADVSGRTIYRALVSNGYLTLNRALFAANQLYFVTIADQYNVQTQKIMVK